MKKSPEWQHRSVLELPYFTLCLSREEFHAELKMLELPERDWPSFMRTPKADATTHWLDNQKGELCCLVCLCERDGVESIQVAGLLVHEAVHIWQAYVERFGGDDSNEFEAYSIQTISQRLMYEYTRRKCK